MLHPSVKPQTVTEAFRLYRNAKQFTQAALRHYLTLVGQEGESSELADLLGQADTVDFDIILTIPDNPQSGDQCSSTRP